MKLKEGFMLKEVAGSYIVIPVGQVDFTAMITVNETGAFLWEQLMDGSTVEELCANMVREYAIDEQTAKRDIEAFIQILSDNSLLEE
ncbi:MAG: PqqD family protein [Clostridia bacterium]|nr:PqqD family protein [Clostridia bacterium]